MALMTELDIVNRCLATMGELPLNSIEGSRNPVVTNARNAFRDKTIDEQAAGWWYNIEQIKLAPVSPDASGRGEYKAPSDTLALATDQDFNPAWLTLRGSRLYDTGKGEYHTGDRPMDVRLVRLVPFDDLPYSAQRLIRDATVLKFQMDYDGDELKIQEAQGQYREAYGNCMTDHIRSVKANLLYKGSNGVAIMRARVPYARGRRP